MPATKDNQQFCSICAHDIHSRECPHSWNKPFHEWPSVLLDKLRNQIR